MYLVLTVTIIVIVAVIASYLVATYEERQQKQFEDDVNKYFEECTGDAQKEDDFINSMESGVEDDILKKVIFSHDSSTLIGVNENNAMLYVNDSVDKHYGDEIAPIAQSIAPIAQIAQKEYVYVEYSDEYPEGEVFISTYEPYNDEIGFGVTNDDVQLLGEL